MNRETKRRNFRYDMMFGGVTVCALVGAGYIAALLVRLVMVLCGVA